MKIAFCGDSFCADTGKDTWPYLVKQKLNATQIWKGTPGANQYTILRHTQKILNLEDFADLASDELTGGFDVVKGEKIRIQGYLEDFALSKTEADNLIMSARDIVYKN